MGSYAHGTAAATPHISQGLIVPTIPPSPDLPLQPKHLEMGAISKMMRKEHREYQMTVPQTIHSCFPCSQRFLGTAQRYFSKKDAMVS